uniref:Uncharacterized protein n=1 Tax=Solanum tuberosum TaxID=4113 RepID=M0ZQQ5_SOLTU
MDSIFTLSFIFESIFIKSLKGKQIFGYKPKSHNAKLQQPQRAGNTDYKSQKPKKWVVHILYTAVYLRHTVNYSSKMRKYRDEIKYRCSKARNT